MSNTGDWNTGNWNSGDYNTGNWNSGDLNIGDCNTGDLNTETHDNLRLFNKNSGWKRGDKNHNKLRNIIRKYQMPLTELISEQSMTDEEKEKYPTYKTAGGYLKVNKERYNNLDISDFLLSVPNFDNEILKECTGIDIENTKVKITIDGKEIWISKESAKELAESLCC